MLPILQPSPGDSSAAVGNHFATLCVALSPLINRIGEQSRFFLKSPVSSSAYPALKTHCSLTCAPHAFWGARTRLMCCSPSAIGKYRERIKEYTQTESTVCCKSLYCKRNAKQRQNLVYSPGRGIKDDKGWYVTALTIISMKVAVHHWYFHNC